MGRRESYCIVGGNKLLRECVRGKISRSQIARPADKLSSKQTGMKTSSQTDRRTGRQARTRHQGIDQMKWTGNGEDGLENCVEATEKGLRIEHCWSNAANQNSRLRPWIRCNTSLWGVRKKNDGREDRKKNGRIKGLNRSVDR